VAEILDVAPGASRVVLLVVAHADDPALFIGGTIARLADAGWRVVCVRATDDRWDSCDLSEAETITANHTELRVAASILGIDEIVELDLPTDVLADASEVRLRERIIHAVRTHRPYALVTFDPYAMFGEDNQDHLVVAAATDEAFWTSQFPLHHPEHLAAGLEPHGCFERWYFGRRVVEVTHAVEIGAVIDRKVDAALAHDTMMRNYLNQIRLQARTGGWELPHVEAALADGDLRPVLEPLLRRGAELVGARHGVAMAEELRIVRFGGLEGLLEARGRRLA